MVEVWTVLLVEPDLTNRLCNCPDISYAINLGQLVLVAFQTNQSNSDIFSD
jgi:hypothetical protein